jgi:ribonuclease J
MNSIKIIIHRGTHEIGGSCIEIATEKSRILIDAGSPLEVDDFGKEKDLVPRSLTASLRKSTPAFSGIIISHPHLDHYGLLSRLPQQPPIYTGRLSAVLMKLTNELSNKPMTWRATKPISDRTKVLIGDFMITPYLMDHSGLDSYALLIEADGKRVFYSGDFRSHGRKAATFKRFLREAPKNIDVLILEGTTVGASWAISQSEMELEAQFVEHMNKTKGPVFITLAGQNIDRIVTAYKAAKVANRLFIIDPYIAEVLDRIHKQYEASGRKCRFPHASWPKIKVCFPERLCSWLKKKRLGNICSKYKKYEIQWEQLSNCQDRIAMVLRPSSTEEVTETNLFNLADALWIYSMWDGYLMRDKKLIHLDSEFKIAETTRAFLHTSGHADSAALCSMVDALKPSMTIPMHTAHPVMFRSLFPNVMTLDDGVPYTV